MIVEGETEQDLLDPSFFSVGSVSRNKQNLATNTLETALSALKSIVNGVFPSINHIHGFVVEFYFPDVSPVPTNDEVYGTFAAEQGYTEEPSLVKRVPVTGAMVDRIYSGDQLDAYFGPPPVIWMVGDIIIPEDTKVRILLKKKNFIEFKVNQTVSMYGIDDSLLNKLILNPVASQF
jgi:hypothetical protein